jgi:hypothetical protein
MRRALASLLLALFSFPLIVPVLRADSASDVPVCCRRSGQHHCGMPDESTGSGASSLQSRCPVYPKAGVVAFSLDSILLNAAPQSGAHLALRLASPKADVDIPQIALRGPAHKRGPPALLD